MELRRTRIKVAFPESVAWFRRVRKSDILQILSEVLPVQSLTDYVFRL